MTAARILVTGASGFVGRHVVRALLDAGNADLVCAARDAARLKSRLEREVATIELDVMRPETWHGMDFSRHDRLVHLAWDHLDRFDHSGHLDTLLPAHGAFLRAAIEGGIGALSVTGTCLEYGLVEGALTEDIPCRPVTAYGKAKNALREMLEQAGAKLQWIRLFYLYGPGQQEKSILSQLDRAIARGDARFDMSKGDQQRDYLPVEEAGRRIARIVANDRFAGAVNCCSGAPIAIRALVERRLAERGARMHLNLGKFPYPSYEPFAFWGDATRMNRVLAGAA